MEIMKKFPLNEIEKFTLREDNYVLEFDFNNGKTQGLLELIENFSKSSPYYNKANETIDRLVSSIVAYKCKNGSREMCNYYKSYLTNDDSFNSFGKFKKRSKKDLEETIRDNLKMLIFYLTKAYYESILMVLENQLNDKIITEDKYNILGAIYATLVGKLLSKFEHPLIYLEVHLIKEKKYGYMLLIESNARGIVGSYVIGPFNKSTIIGKNVSILSKDKDYVLNTII
ncbi:MAG: hypothetical protein GU343_02190 [Nanoarchaeota archaeon]|jgi:hypothetical protein|nr:hypothetical protein [Nanoarchaeota archaeon]